MDLTIEQLDAPTYELRTLLADLDAYLAGLYLPEQLHGWSIERLFAPDVNVFLAKRNNLAVGCAALALFDDFGEIKRMFVPQHLRGQGIGPALMKRLENEARAAGMTWLRLETGHAQLSAMKMYEACGFHPRRAFGDYLALPPLTLATSRFYEMKL